MARSRWWRPNWARPFIVEPEDVSELDPLKTNAPWAAIGISILLVAGLGLQIVAFVQHQTTLGIAVIVLYGVSLLRTTVFRPRTASVVLCLLTTALSALQVVTLFSSWNDDDQVLVRRFNQVKLALSSVLLILLLNMPIRSPSSDLSGISVPYSEPTSRLRSPEDNLTPWMWLVPYLNHLCNLVPIY